MFNILLISCPDRVGLIHSVTTALRGKNLNIVANSEHVDSDSAWFFMRTEFTGETSGKELTDELCATLPKPAQIRLAGDAPRDVVILAGKEPHCAGDLLLRHANGELNARILAVVSNHPDLAKLVARFDIPFYHVPVESEDRAAHESKLMDVIRPLRPRYLVLAKYMRILTPAFAAAFPNQILNIHHSFLPAFIGANPYKQAYLRGVKVIGATAHFVNEGLDEGPIIAQSVIPVTHSHTIKSMTQEGREIEKIVLARALRLVLEDRVFVHGNRTVIFE
jgi:formyltetrahydrofolate deformylase